MSSPLCQKLRVKTQGKQTSLCLENAGPSLACQYLRSLYFLPTEPLFRDNGRVGALTLLSARLHFFVLLNNDLKSPLGVEMVERKWGGARGLA